MAVPAGALLTRLCFHAAQCPDFAVPSASPAAAVHHSSFLRGGELKLTRAVLSVCFFTL